MDSFEQTLDTVLRNRVAGIDRLISAERLSGGASQETYRLTVEVDGQTQLLALRRAAGGETGTTVEGRPGLPVEARLMQAARAAGVPEPEVYLVLEPEDGLGDGFVMEWLDGETLGARIIRAPELDEIRPHLAYQCGQVLAAIHAIDPVATGLSAHLETLTPEAFVERMWTQYRELNTPQPMIDYAARWLLDHLPETPELRLVHNDFRNGNVMVSPQGVVAVLDWEVAHLGDPMRDLGWICTNSWRFGRRDLPVGGFGHYDDLFAGYESVSGQPVDRDRVRFWEVFGSYWWAIGCLKMGDHYRNGPDPTVERPGISRRSSECQVDCVNLLIPGPVQLVMPATALSSTDLPGIDELVISVRDFLRGEVMAATEGRTSFMARVAANSLDIVLRELALTPAHQAAELARLRALVGDRVPGEGDALSLRWALADAVRHGEIALDRADLQHHLRTTVVNQAGIDQPNYSGYQAAIATDQAG
jgi:aminoglycoside phosphotransferase (APT) family kinase protein